MHSPASRAEPPWRPGSELTSPSAALRDRVGAVRATLAARAGLAAGDIEVRVAASAVHLGLAARFAAPALGAAVLGCPLDLRPGGLWWQDTAGGPVPLSVPTPAPGGHRHRAAPPSGRAAPPAGRAGPVGAARADLAGWASELLDELLAPVTTAVAELFGVSGRVLWGNVASAVNAAARQVARQRPDLAETAWQAAGQLFARPPLRAERNPPGPAFRRSSCCLFYRLAPADRSAVCGDCVLADRPG